VKIAVECEPLAAGRGRSVAPGYLARRELAYGNDWSVWDVICSGGPHNRGFEEQHSQVCIAIVVGGSFQYRSSAGRELMTPGSLLLGSPGQYFECGHEHGMGDHCISFAYEPRYFDEVATEAGVPSRSAPFAALRVPPVRELSRLVARACAALAESNCRASVRNSSVVASKSGKRARNQLERRKVSTASVTEWEAIGLELAAQSLEIANRGGPNEGRSLAAEARVTRIIRLIEARPDSNHDLGALAGEAKLSRYHFLRVFQQLTGLTPHRYIVRARLRRAATRLMLESARVLDIALDSGFGDVSNFNHAFYAEFRVSPRSFRKNARLGGVAQCGLAAATKADKRDALAPLG